MCDRSCVDNECFKSIFQKLEYTRLVLDQLLFLIDELIGSLNTCAVFLLLSLASRPQLNSIDTNHEVEDTAIH